MLKAANDPTVGSSPHKEKTSSDPTVESGPIMEKAARKPIIFENEPTGAVSEPTTTSSDSTTTSRDPTTAVNDPTTTSSDASTASSPKDSSNVSEEKSGAMKILRCIVDNQKYPITLKTFHKLFSRFGKVKKIVLFTKNGQLQALIEFQDSATAQKALIALDNKNIYDGCCYMRIDYSNIQDTLKVQFNNDKTWDFTRPDLPTSGPTETADERTQDSPQQSQPNVRGMNNRGRVFRGNGDMGYGRGRLQDNPQHSQPHFRGGNYRGGGARGKGDTGYGMENMRGHQYQGRGMDRSMRTMGRNRGHVGKRNHPYERQDMRQGGMGNNRGSMMNSGRAMHRPRGNMGGEPRGMRGMGRPMSNMDHTGPDRGTWRGNMRGHYMGGMDAAGSGQWN